MQIRTIDSKGIIELPDGELQMIVHIRDDAILLESNNRPRLIRGKSASQTLEASPL